MKKPIAPKKAIARKKTPLVKKATYEASPVSRKEVDAIKVKLRKKANKVDAMKVAQTELKAEKVALRKKAHLKLLEALYQANKNPKK